MLPPLLLLGLITLLAIVHRHGSPQPGDGLIQAVVSGLAHRATGLLTAYLLTLAILAIRQRVRTQAGVDRPPATRSERDPRRRPVATTGAPSEKSTTVVGSEPHSPAVDAPRPTSDPALP